MSEPRRYTDAPTTAKATRDRLSNTYALDNTVVVRRVRTMANIVVAQMLPDAAI